MTIRILLSTVLGAALLSPGTEATAQSGEAQVLDRVRIERLSDLGRLWGYIKFAHPALAYRDIDWDSALLRALPAVRAARSTDAYVAAVNGMLSALNDPPTRAARAPLSAQGTSAPSSAPPVRTIDGVLVVNLAALAGDSVGAAESKIAAESAAAKGIVLDLRLQPSVEGMLAFLANLHLRPLIGRFVERPVVLGALRSRHHYGYPAQNGLPSGGYASQLVTAAPGTITGRAKPETALPIVLLANARAQASFADVLVGLKAAGLARVVEEASSEEGALLANVKLVEDVDVHVTTSEVVAPDGQVGVRPDLSVRREVTSDRALEAAVRLVLAPLATMKAAAPTAFALQPARDNAYPEMTLPDADHRLLALFRMWTVVRYFFPYYGLMERPWSDALIEFLPRFEAADTTLAYQTAVLELAARLQDSHVGVTGATAAQEHIGLFAPPFLVSEIEGQAVVRHVHDPDAAKAIHVGDVILSVDGVPIEERRKSLAPLIAASTPQAMSLGLDRMQLRGPKDSEARLRVRDAAGTEREVLVARSRPSGRGDWLPDFRKTPETYAVLPSGFGYIDLQRLPLAEADAALDAVMGTRGLIFDMRGYPKGTAWPIAPRLVKAPATRPLVGAQFQPPFLDATSMPFDVEAPVTGRFTFDQTLSDTTKPRYQGKVVVLIDAWAISQAEHTCLFFSAATDVTFVGTPTNGANGDITNMVLPGGLFVSFTGQEVRHADGRQLQRVGVQPDIIVKATITGIRAGRDEVLEAAIEYLRKHAR